MANAQQPLHQAICHVDLDAFYAQVEAKQHPELCGKPLGVVQYNPYGNLETRAPGERRIMNDSNGSLIAVSYEARAAGVKRNMRGDQARAACPEIQLVQVPTAHGKADLSLYRSEGRRVLQVLARLARAERASIDECYLDLTEEAQRRLAESGGVPPLPPSPERVHVVGGDGAASPAPAWWRRPPEAWAPGERLLACAAAAAAELRAAVEAELGYTCSAGVAHTKLLAKLCSGLHKPAQQTVLPAEAVPALLGPLPIPKLKGLGGKFGEQVMAQLGIEIVGQLAAVPLSRLEAAFGDKDAAWLFALARGVTDDSVEERRLPKSINCGKTFRGRQALVDAPAVHKWLLELGGELAERLEEDRESNNRVPQLLTVTISNQLPWAASQKPGATVQAAAGYHSTSRSCPLRKLSAEAIADDAAALVRRWAAEQGAGWSISALFVTAGSFVPVQSAASAITRFFKPRPAGETAGASACGGAQAAAVSAGPGMAGQRGRPPAGISRFLQPKRGEATDKEQQVEAVSATAADGRAATPDAMARPPPVDHQHDTTRPPAQQQLAQPQVLEQQQRRQPPPEPRQQNTAGIDQEQQQQQQQSLAERHEQAEAKMQQMLQHLDQRRLQASRRDGGKRGAHAGGTPSIQAFFKRPKQ